MKRIIISFFLSFPISLFAQNIDDIGRIVIGVHISKSSSAETQNLSDPLKNKLSQIITQSGYSAFGGNNLFVITPNVIVNSTDMAEGGMRNVFIVKGELFLSIQERDNSVVYSSISIPFTGTATSKDRAIRNAIVDIDYRVVEPCFMAAKEKILSYYEDKQDVIFVRVNTYLAHNQFDEAITCLMTVPEELSSLYKKSLTRANEIYKLKQEDEQRKIKEEITKYNNAIINKANSYIAMHQPEKALLELSHMVSGNDDQQDITAKEIVSKAENLVTNNEQQAALEAERNYYDAKEREKNEFQLRQQKVELEMKNTALEEERIHTLRSIALAYILNNNSNN